MNLPAETGFAPTRPSLNAMIEQLIQRASGARSRSGNQIELLLDSTENFPEWEAALRGAARPSRRKTGQTKRRVTGYRRFLARQQDKGGWL